MEQIKENHRYSIQDITYCSTQNTSILLVCLCKTLQNAVSFQHFCVSLEKQWFQMSKVGMFFLSTIHFPHSLEIFIITIAIDNCLLCCRKCAGEVLNSNCCYVQYEQVFNKLNSHLFNIFPDIHEACHFCSFVYSK